MKINDLEKPANLTVKVKSGKLLQMFLFKCLEMNLNVNDQFNIWIAQFLGLSSNKKEKIDMYVEYMVNNSDKIITRTDLRNLHLVNGNKFKKYFEEHFEKIKFKLLDYGYTIKDAETKRNFKAYEVVKVV